MLINSGASVNAESARGVIALRKAARMQHVELAHMLLKHKAEVNAKDDSGKTPLDWAGLHSRTAEMLKLLQNHGAISGKPQCQSEPWTKKKKSLRKNRVSQSFR